ncbi:zinc phosphodiesterase ELAC protein 2-like isoform X2 [Mytilus galloprovincialis]|uniref:zinc phosphodiesterase ELAC protein 2-like isoform X1 n=1 Tax=Mytilus galloprovincialis TaxID=29158 RepID=UPI003F7BB57B
MLCRNVIVQRGLLAFILKPQTNKVIKRFKAKFKRHTGKREFKPEGKSTESLQKSKNENVVRTSSFSNFVELCVISSGGPGTPKSVILVTTNGSFVFNCGEGTQRIKNVCFKKFARIENVFITHKSWDNLGGLYGMSLGLAVAGVGKVTVHGPVGIESVVQRKAYMMLYDDIKTKLDIGRQSKAMTGFSNPDLSIDYVPLLPEKKEDLYNPPKDQESSSPLSQQLLSFYTPLSDPDCTYAYIIKPNPKNQVVNYQKCIDLGINDVSMVKQLRNGENATLSDGRIIYPDDVLTEKDIARPIIVVECPSEDYLYSLLRSEKLSECQGDYDDSAELVVHMSSYNMVNNPQYQQFIQRFPSSTVHMFLHEKTSNMTSEGMIQLQSILNMVHSDIFPRIHMGKQQMDNYQMENYIMAKPFMRYSYRPKLGISDELCIPDDIGSKMFTKLSNDEQFMKTVTDYKSLMSTKQLENNKSQYPEVAFLGTGSGFPGKFRNVTSFIINIDEDTSILMDCGDGTINQLYMLYGDKTDEILINMKCIYISHLHADHHLGLAGILLARKAALERAGKEYTKVYLLAPIRIKRWLHVIIDKTLHMKYYELIQLVPNEAFMSEHYRPADYKEEQNQALCQTVLSLINCKEIVAVPVNHYACATGVSLVHSSGWKIVYSGDTMPCQSLVEAGKDCDLLIHEATLQSDMAETAKELQHSTVKQALDIGNKMQAKYQILTHFSQRYHRIPLIEDNSSHKRFGLAYDLMKVKLSELSVLYDMINPLKEIFHEDIDLVMQVHTRKQNKSQLIKEISQSLSKEKS